MDTQKRKRDEYESDLITSLRLGSISILDALAKQLPDVFTAEILPKLGMKDTLNLAQVNKTYNAAVWSVGGVRSLEAKLKAHVEKTDENRVTEPIIQAVSHGNVPAVRALLESGVDVNKKVDVSGQYLYSKNLNDDDDDDNDNDDDESYSTALHLAAANGHVATVKLLIEKGADLNIRQESSFGYTGTTPLSLAAVRGNPLCAVELLKAGAAVDLASSSGDTPLMLAAGEGREAIVALLIGYGADVDLVNDNGETALTFVNEAFQEVAFLSGSLAGWRSRRRGKISPLRRLIPSGTFIDDCNDHHKYIPIRENLHGVLAMLEGTDRACRYNSTTYTWTYPEQCHHV